MHAHTNVRGRVTLKSTLEVLTRENHWSNMNVKYVTSKHIRNILLNSINFVGMAMGKHGLAIMPSVNTLLKLKMIYGCILIKNIWRFSRNENVLNAVMKPQYLQISEGTRKVSMSRLGIKSVPSVPPLFRQTTIFNAMLKQCMPKSKIWSANFAISLHQSFMSWEDT